MPADGTGEAVQIIKGGAYYATPAPDGKTVFFAKSEIPTEMWRVPTEGGAEEIVPEFTAAGLSGNWTTTKTGIYFLARNSDQSYKIKFYDFAAEQIKEFSGDYKLPANVLTNRVATDGNDFLYSVQDQNACRLMLAELP